MARQFSLPDQFPPIGILPPAADAAGRTGNYYTLKGADKAWIVARVNQGNAATVQFSLLQATNVAGANSKAINATRIWLVADTSTSDAVVAQADAATFTTSATTKDKIVIFEILPERVLDVANGFVTIALQTGASNAANITAGELVIWQRYEGADKISALTN